MFTKQLSIFIENRKGRLAEITQLLADNHINIRALSIADTTSFGILRIIVDEPYMVENLLKSNNITVSVTSVVTVSIPDRPGGLAEVLRILSDENIQLEYMYAFITKTADAAYVAMRIEEDLKAQRILIRHGYKGFNEVIE